ncbi:glutaredoxin family protein [Photobacterium rosenbergii]|uniref:Glutaredoxin family protein n=1 Tax=Photobacterium rosenbergii TaxID=294936 RepID=A0ABU3ZFE5_9GAMM|nr:glutaredoxin family protein [Photobacterium rosenbergii]MDV5168844.1 glutaredoxin family protein [Photobacterium rosenbergii]
MLITLYSTEGCHLCEQAYSLLVQAGVEERVQVVDIAFDDALFSRYGVTIPVLAILNPDSDSNSPELGWPFDADELAQWLNNNGIN